MSNKDKASTAPAPAPARTTLRRSDEYGGHYPDCIPGVLCHCPIEDGAPAPAGGPPLDAAQREIKTCHEMLDSNRDVLPAGLLPERLSALLADIDRMTSQLRADREVPASVMEMPMDAAARVRDGARPAPAPASGGRPVTRAQVDACLARHGRAVIDRGIGLVIDDILCDLGITVIATPATAEGEGGDGE
jgi:hypothetical protein